MGSERAKKPPTSVGSFEPFFDFRANLRRLAIFLADMHGLRGQKTAWPFTGEGPVSAEERAALVRLAVDHLVLHASGVPDTEPRCRVPDGSCKALGGAQVAFALISALEDEPTGKAAAGLHDSLKELESALSDFCAGLRGYLGTRVAIHKKKRLCAGSAHMALCTYPREVFLKADHLRLLLPLFDSVSVIPQIPDHLRSTARRGLLVSLELTLAGHGWTFDEILAVLHDAVDTPKDTDRKRKGRLKLRLNYHASTPVPPGSVD